MLHGGNRLDVDEVLPDRTKTFDLRPIIQEHEYCIATSVETPAWMQAR
jgi:hypothetical protein